MSSEMVIQMATLAVWISVSHTLRAKACWWLSRFASHLLFETNRVLTNSRISHFPLAVLAHLLLWNHHTYCEHLVRFSASATVMWLLMTWLQYNRRCGGYGPFVTTFRHWSFYHRGWGGLCGWTYNSNCTQAPRDEVCNVLFKRICICSFWCFSPLWEMVQEGIDINSIDWSQH